MKLAFRVSQNCFLMSKKKWSICTKKNLISTIVDPFSLPNILILSGSSGGVVGELTGINDRLYIQMMTKPDYDESPEEAQTKPCFREREREMDLFLFVYVCVEYGNPKKGPLVGR